MRALPLVIHCVPLKTVQEVASDLGINLCYIVCLKDITNCPGDKAPGFRVERAARKFQAPREIP